MDLKTGHKIAVLKGSEKWGVVKWLLFAVGNRPVPPLTNLKIWRKLGWGGGDNVTAVFHSDQQNLHILITYSQEVDNQLKPYWG